MVYTLSETAAHTGAHAHAHTHTQTHTQASALLQLRVSTSTAVMPVWWLLCGADKRRILRGASLTDD